MGGSCEIVEEKDVPSTTQQTLRQLRSQEKDKKNPLKKGLNKIYENDINKLFESVNLRTSKSLDLTDSFRNASKKPMRFSSGFNSPVGFSEPVSLKQALRGLCISQAAEIAASKRLASPRISNLMSSATPSSCPSPFSSVRPVMKSVECISTEIPANKPSLNLKEPKIIPVCEEDYQLVANVCTQEKKLDIVSAPPHHNVSKPESKVSCSKKVASVQSEIPAKSPKLKIIPAREEDYQLVANVCSQEKKLDVVSAPPHHTVSKPESKVSCSKKVASVQSEIPAKSPKLKIIPAREEDYQLVANFCSQEKKLDVVSAPPHHTVSKPERKVSCSKKVASVQCEIPATSSKGRRKSRLRNVSSSSEIKSNKETKAVRSNPHALKPVTIKKTIKLALTTGGNSKTLNGVHNVSEHSSGKLVCQSCQCSMKEPVSAPTVNKNKDISVAKNHITYKIGEKVVFSQSSKGSGCGFSSSTTSPSEENSLSGSSSGTRPHMSKDMRWGVINRVKEHYSFLGLSQFNLLKKLGAGDIGTVYLAELIGTNCPFAIKVMDNNFLGKRKKIARAQTEREILRMLDHPFLPTLYAQFMSDNLSCLVMEFCPGGDLHVLRQKQPCRYFPEQAARFYAAEVLLALEYLHMLGIIYRDLKPENILVREDGHIMLTDFDLSLRCSVSPTLVKSSAPGIEPPRVSGTCAGSNCIDPFCAGPSCKMSCFSPRIFPASSRARKLKAKAVAHTRSLPQVVAEPTGARSNSFVGTHEYLAPEIIKGEGHGSAVDWWTFGVLLYELLYGKTPFRGVGNDETLSNVVFQSLKYPDTPIVSSQARDLIRGLLVKDPDNRFGTETGAAEIKRHPFFEGLNWALIRCTVPPQIPEFYEVGNFQVESEEKGGHIEFELF